MVNQHFLATLQALTTEAIIKQKIGGVCSATTIAKLVEKLNLEKFHITQMFLQLALVIEIILIYHM